MRSKFVLCVVAAFATVAFTLPSDAGIFGNRGGILGLGLRGDRGSASCGGFARGARASCGGFARDEYASCGFGFRAQPAGVQFQPQPQYVPAPAVQLQYQPTSYVAHDRVADEAPTP